MATQFDILAYRIDKLKKQLGYKQIKYSDGPLSGPVTCCNILGVDKTTGTIYYKDEEGNWAEVPGGGGEPAKYKVYTALLTQYGTNAPTATVLENTLGGSIVWTRDAVGVYKATLVGIYSNINKFWGIISLGDSAENIYIAYDGDPDYFLLNVYFGGTTADHKLIKASIEIRVYN